MRDPAVENSYRRSLAWPWWRRLFFSFKRNKGKINIIYAGCNSTKNKELKVTPQNEMFT
jgi:hypothetical protein